MYQQQRRGSSSLKFPKFKGKAINGGPFNQLEHTLLCPIILIMEQTNQQLSSMNVFKMFNDIVSKLDEFSFKDPSSLTMMHHGHIVVSVTQKSAIRVSGFNGGEIHLYHNHNKTSIYCQHSCKASFPLCHFLLTPLETGSELEHENEARRNNSKVEMLLG